MRAAAALLFGALACAGCRHDERELTPTLEDVPTWLSSASATCASCIASTCAGPAEACIADPSCNETFRTCQGVDPSCALASRLHRSFGVCVASGCRSECELEARELACVGQFEWKAEVSERLELEVRAISLSGTFAPVVVDVCAGVESICDPQSTTTLTDREPKRVTFTSSVPGLAPYFRVTGDALMPMLFFEYLPIPTGYQVRIPLLSRRGFAFVMDMLGGQLDPQRGALNLMPFACTGTGVEGARFELHRDGKPVPEAERGIPYYYEGPRPVRTPMLGSTRAPLFWGGFVNLSPGVYDVRVFKGDRLISRAPATVVLADTLTHVNLFPLSRADPAP